MCQTSRAGSDETSRAGSDESQKRSKFPIASKPALFKSFLEIYAEMYPKGKFFGFTIFWGWGHVDEFSRDMTRINLLNSYYFRVSNDFTRIFLMGGSSRIF